MYHYLVMLRGSSSRAIRIGGPCNKKDDEKDWIMDFDNIQTHYRDFLSVPALKRLPDLAALLLVQCYNYIQG